jgi:hypothetical protein
MANTEWMVVEMTKFTDVFGIKDSYDYLVSHKCCILTEYSN